MTPEIEKKRRELFDQYCAGKGYGSFTTRELLWPCFNAALDAVEIVLPQDRGLSSYEDFCATRDQCKKAITATGLGLKVK